MVDRGASWRSAEADDAGDPGGVAHDGQSAAAPIPKRNKQVVGHAARSAKAVDEHGGAVGQVRDGGWAVGVDLAGRLARRESEAHLPQDRSDADGGCGHRANVFCGPSGGHFGQGESDFGHAQHGDVGHDRVDAADPIRRQGQGIYDVGRAIIGGVGQNGDHAAGSGREVDEAGMSLWTGVVRGMVTGDTSVGIDLRGGQD